MIWFGLVVLCFCCSIVAHCCVQDTIPPTASKVGVQLLRFGTTGNRCINITQSFFNFCVCYLINHPNFLEFEQTVRQMFKAQIAAVRAEHAAQLAERRDPQPAGFNAPARFNVATMEKYVARAASRSSIFRIYCYWYINQGQAQCMSHISGVCSDVVRLLQCQYF